MNSHSNILDYDLIGVIVDFGKASKVIKCAKQCGVNGATVLLGKGTVHNHILQMLDLTDVRKEIILFITEKSITSDTVRILNEKFHFDKPHHGIAFISSVVSFLGHPNSVYKNEIKNGGIQSNMYNAIFVVVDKGKADAVVDSAISAGSRGATIINGRGSGIHEQKMLFSFPIEPEKEIVMILAKQKNTEAIVSKVREDSHIDKPGMGILFILPVSETYGLYES